MIFFPFERPEPDGAEGQPGSLAIGNNMIVLPCADFAQVQSHVILHRIKLHNGAGLNLQPPSDQSAPLARPASSDVGGDFSGPLEGLPISLRAFICAQVQEFAEADYRGPFS